MQVIDPSQTLDDALEAIFDNDDLDEAHDKLVELRNWLRNGGQNPDFTGRAGQWRCEKMMDCLFHFGIGDES